jgi:hypothetical protein
VRSDPAPPAFQARPTFIIPEPTDDSISQLWDDESCSRLRAGWLPSVQCSTIATSPTLCALNLGEGSTLLPLAHCTGAETVRVQSLGMPVMKTQCTGHEHAQLTTRTQYNPEQATMTFPHQAISCSSTAGQGASGARADHPGCVLCAVCWQELQVSEVLQPSVFAYTQCLKFPPRSQQLRTVRCCCAIIWLLL